MKKILICGKNYIMKILKWSNSTSLKMKQEDMHLLCLLKNGLGKQMLLELSLNVNDFLGYSTISSTEIYATPDSKKTKRRNT